MKLMLIYPPAWKIAEKDAKPYLSKNGGQPKGKDVSILKGDNCIIPWGVMTIGVLAKSLGHETCILNFSTFAWTHIEKIITNEKFDIYGLSCFTSNRRGTFELAKLIKRKYPEARIITGGPFPSALPAEMLQHCPEIDAVVIGEGEETFKEVFKKLEQNKQLKNIPGLCWREEGKITFGKQRERISNLDQLPNPTEYYNTHTLLTSRGCPGNCTYCGSPAMWGKKLFFNSPDYVFQMLEKAVNRHGNRMICFKDDTFTSDRRRAKQICTGIIARKLNFLWSCDTRVDSLDEELLLLMRKAGCQRISLGVESASPEILKNIKKRTTPEQVLQVTETARKFGFQIRYFMMVGNRGETEESLRTSIEFVKKAKPTQAIFSFLQLNPGTEDFRIAEEKGWSNRQCFFERDFFSNVMPLFARPSPGLKNLVTWADAHSFSDIWSYSIAQRKQILSLLPDSAAVKMDLADAYYQAGKIDEAEKYVREALAANHPLPGIGYNFLACIEATRGNLKATTDNLLKGKKLGVYALVEKNLAALRKWINSGQAAENKPLTLTANNDFDTVSLCQQPATPGPIAIIEKNSNEKMVFWPQIS